MKEHGLLCTASVALALHEGRQTQDRRPIMPQPIYAEYWTNHDGAFYPNSSDAQPKILRSPVQVGDIFYIKETWTGTWCYESMHLVYAADGTERTIEIPEVPADYALPKVCLKPGKWASPWFMPIWAARTRKRVTGIRVDHGPWISDDDAKAEGIYARGVIGDDPACATWTWSRDAYRYDSPSEAFRALWHILYGDDKPWRWVYELEDVAK